MGRFGQIKLENQTTSKKINIIFGVVIHMPKLIISEISAV